MGVHGLWRLIEPSGKPVPLESLENKVLAVDVSIWLHQIIKGFQDNKGASVPNAHLLGIYHRVCKLLYFRIKPVFVFDGGVPSLKRQTIALRNQQKQKNLTTADRIHKNLLSALIKHTAISKVLSEKAKAAIAESTSPRKSKPEDDLYVLPPSQLDSTVSSDESESEAHSSRHFDLHSIDTESVEFKSLPVDVRHEILTDLKETRKQSSWGRIHELPVESDDFSVYQMNRLLKRQSVQSALEEVEKEMGGHSLSLGELETILKDQGVISNMKGNRIASDENTRFLLIKDIKLALEEARKNLETIEEGNEPKDEDLQAKNKGEKEFEDDLKRAIELSLEEVPSTSKQEAPSTSVKKIGRKGKKRLSLSFLNDFDEADFHESESSEEEEIRTKLTPAQRYMMEYSGLTSHAIAKIIESKSGVSKKISWDDKNETTKPQPEETSTDINITEKSDDNVTKVTEKNGDKVTSVNLTAKTTEENEDNKVTTSTEDPVEVMSDSESSNCDDFLDVEGSKETATVDSMEVIIKPEEELEDDLFKDVFEHEENAAPVSVSSTQEKGIESIMQFVSSSVEESEERPCKNGDVNGKDVVTESIPNEEKVEATVSSSKSTSESTVEKIQKMIQTYSKPKEQEETVKLSVEQMNEMKENLRKEQSELVAEKSSKERLAGNITDQMCQEAQELLELFGVPYLVAPMEAEAQCAFLDLIELTDGTITDDSDIWLFGGRTVYKNFFNQNKLVMEYKSESIHHHYKLTREQMILLAMLVGSDYTTGLTGVGPVTALEILAAFPPKNHLVSGLAEFKSWFHKGRLPGPGRTSLRGKLKNVSFTDNFPNAQIVQAYLEPTVETSKERFSWGKLDVHGLVDFAKRKFGWTQVKSEEILNPILRRLEDSHVQKTITDYFKRERKMAIGDGEAEKMMSKRVKIAVNRIAKGNGDEDEVEAPKPKKRSGGAKKTSGPRGKKSKQDEELEILKETEARSKERVEEIEKEVRDEIKQKEKVDLQRLHRKEVIPQRQKDKSEILKNKLKAIETFRKSKKGPGYVKKRGKSQKELKEDASYLSEGSSSD